MITVILIIVTVVIVIDRIITAILKNEQEPGCDRNTYFTSTQGSQPYANVYGTNRKQGPCAVTVTASPEMAVVVIIRYHNLDGDVAGHLYIEKGSSGTICLPAGRYQTFFYSGTTWDPNKEMDCGLTGGFLNSEIFQEDPVAKNYTEGTRWTYTLRMVSNGNFAPMPTDKDLFF